MAGKEESKDTADIIKSKLGESSGSERSEPSSASGTQSRRKEGEGNQGEEKEVLENQPGSGIDDEDPSRERFKELKDEQKDQKLAEMKREDRREEAQDEMYDPDEDGNILH